MAANLFQLDDISTATSLRDRAQVEQLLRYIVEEPPEDADHKRTFKYPFVASEVITCEIDVILRTLVEEEELMRISSAFCLYTRERGWAGVKNCVVIIRIEQEQEEEKAYDRLF